MSEEPNRVTSFIRFFGTLKDNRDVLPKKPMFTKIKRGGSFPKIASKISAIEYGHFAESVVKKILDDIYHYENIDLESLKYELPEDHRIYFRENDFEDLVAILDYEINSCYIPEYNLEWDYYHQGEYIQGHPDIVIDDCIYDVKATGQFNKMRVNCIYQLLSYYCLGNKLYNNRFKEIGLILPAQKKVLTVNLRNWNYEPFLDRMAEVVKIKKEMIMSDLSFIEDLEFDQNLELVGKSVKYKKDLINYIGYQNPLQIFVGVVNNSNINITRKEGRLYDKLTETCSLYVHSPYTFNLSNPKKDVNGRWIVNKSIQLLDNCDAYGIKGVVFHCGKCGKLSKSKALKYMTESLIDISNGFSGTTKILLETSAGEKGELLSNVEDFIDFYKNLPSENKINIELCLDTCHIFSAGHKITDFFIKIIKEELPVQLIHFNNSRYEMGCCKDRHAPIKMGCIPRSELHSFLKMGIEYDCDLLFEC